MIDLRLGDCLEVMKELPANSIDSIVTDPPYGLSFMGKDWDHGVPGDHFWIEALRVAKPGAHLLAFGGTRTFHRLAVAIEDAGWEIRDCIAWVYGSGFPKSHDVSKAIDREAGARRERNVIPAARSKLHGDRPWMNDPDHRFLSNTPATPEAARWQGWGTALKPAFEPIIVARKPLTGTVASNVLEWGTGAINVDGCRVGFVSEADRAESTNKNQHEDFGTEPMTGNNAYGDWSMVKPKNYNPPGRWPANFIHDGSEEVLALMPETGKSRQSYRGLEHSGRHGGLSDLGGNIKDGTNTIRGHDDNGGSAARFFYCTKASKRDRDEGCEGLELRPAGGLEGRNNGNLGSITMSRNAHPTVKPTDLMRYLCRLVTPPGGIILDPFMGSGSTGKAAVIEGFSFIGIDLNPEYLEIARRRIEFANSYLVELQPALEMAV